MTDKKKATAPKQEPKAPEPIIVKVIAENGLYVRPEPKKDGNTEGLPVLQLGEQIEATEHNKTWYAVDGGFIMRAFVEAV